MSTPTNDRKVWDHYYIEEADAAFLYRGLATAESDPKRRDLFERLAAVEDQHVEHWARLIAEDGRPVPSHRPGLRARGLAWIAGRLGPAAVLPWILAEEGREVAAYLRLAKKTDHPALRDTAATIAIESAEHARELAHLVGRPVEPWHTAKAGGYVRSVVYGFNDGLTANFGLVAGMIGANVSPQIVILSGVAGMVADALSMGSSGYLAAKSESEVHAHEIEMEREELRLMPEIEREELVLIYEAKGVPAELARSMATALMVDPEQALRTKVREELEIGDPDVSPLRDGLITGTATAVGAFIPILPFLVMASGLAIWVSLTISMLAHFAVGAARSLFTGRGLWASGRDMFLVGFGVAAVGYLIGMAVPKQVP